MTAEGRSHRVRRVGAIAAAVGLSIPGLVLRFTGADAAPLLEASLFGLAIVGAGLILAWATEVAQLDLAQGLALAILAAIAVLPEYAVDAVFTWKAGKDPTSTPRWLSPT